MIETNNNYSSGIVCPSGLVECGSSSRLCGGGPVVGSVECGSSCLWCEGVWGVDTVVLWVWSVDPVVDGVRVCGVWIQ